MPERYAHYKFHVEHIVAIQHGGQTKLENLAYACSFCNWKKGPNLATILVEDGPITRLFHPRRDQWEDHFEIEDSLIGAKSEIGEATIRLLEFNHPDNIIERRALLALGYFPQ